MRRLLVLLTVLVAAVAVAGAAASPAAAHHAAPRRLGAVAPSAPAAPGPVVCNQPVLDSPWTYDGAATTFTSGEYPGLPTFGSAGTDFPAATAGVIVPAGDNTAAALAGTYQVNSTVVYFEPGEHDIQDIMYTGHNSAYVGGYTPVAGKTVINGVDGATHGSGNGGNILSLATTSSNYDVFDDWEYLTIENYTASENGSVMGNINGGGFDNGDVYKFDTIGPNNYGYTGPSTPPALSTPSAPGQGGGYGIDAGSNTTIEYDCLAQDAQGAFNSSGAINLVITNNEISRDGLGEYPDTGSSPGQSPFACGCSGGGKAFFTLNADVVNNYVHDNYNVGIWFDFDNAGLLFSHNYVADNWSAGFFYEASYNADIADNTFTGNGWASDGAWPAGVGGGNCYGGVSCTNGNGPVTGLGGGNPFGAIDLSDSGGNTNLNTVDIPAITVVPGCSSSCTQQTRYQGELLVQGNILKDNFGGVKAYTDTNRYVGNGSGDSACSIPLGALGQTNSATYYQQTKVLATASDATISGSSVTSTGGTITLCADYGSPIHSDNPGGVVQAPSVGMAVYNLATNAYLGDIATVTSANAFTLNTSPGDVSGAALYVSAYGGCGPADYFGAGPGVSTGTPSAPYWDNCIWGSRNVKVSGNVFSMSASTVTGCTTANKCGYQYLSAFNAGVQPLLRYFGTYQTYITHAFGGLGDVWSGNAYTWSGGGPGAWVFTTGTSGNDGSTLTQSQWQGSPNNQDAGSSFG